MIPRYATRRPRVFIGRAGGGTTPTLLRRKHPLLTSAAYPAAIANSTAHSLHSRWNHYVAQQGILPTLSAVSTRPSLPLSAVALLPGSGQEVRPSTKKRRSRGSRGKSKRQENKQLEPTLAKKDKRKSPFGDQLPKHELHRWYLNQHPEFEFDDRTYQFTQVKQEVSWLTATFTCPVTQQVYESGTFRTQERWGDSKIINGKVHYRNLTAAVHAAAARAMDEILFNETGRSEHRLCQEDPSQPSTIQFFVESQTPKWNVNNYYTHMHGIERFDKDPYHVTQMFEDGKFWYNATFTCPVTQRVFESGTRIDCGEERHRVVDGKVFYSSAKGAIHAAAARVMDDISFRERGIPEPRLCEEQPIHFDDNTNAMVVEGKNVEMPAAEPETKEAVEQEEASEVIAAVPARRIPSSIQYFSTERMADEDEYVMQNISDADASNERSSTLERVLEAWAESVSKPKQVQPARSSDTSSTHMPMSWSFLEQKKKAIRDASSWYDQMEGKASGGFTKMQNVMSRAAGNAMLRALANANDLTVDDDNLNRRLQETSQKILDYMGQAAQKPSTETYNAYLGCLSRSDRLEAAQAAQAILQSMKSQDDGLPEPNTETYNTVMKLWRDVGGDDGVRKCEELMAGLEDDRLKPTRESFLILLSSLALPRDDRTIFPREKALKWIERMRSTFADSMDQTLIPDTEVYNAPLRWSGGIEGAISRPFSYVAPWDDHSTIFGGGFRPEGSEMDETPSEKEAQQYESWLRHMEDDAKILPDIQTYESIIQAWTRTGTREGVKKAEAWAKQAIDSGFNVRLQTFHPILAAWAYSGDIRAPRKVRYRIDRLLEMSEARPETAPDGRLYLALLTAWRSYQTNIEKLTTPTTESSYSIGQLVTLVSKDLNGETGTIVDIVRKGTFVVKLDSGNSVNKRWSSLRPIGDATHTLDIVDDDSSDDKDRNPIALLEECAQACTDCLKEMCDRTAHFRHGDSEIAFFFDASAFGQTVGAWGELVRYCQNEDDENNRDIIENGVRSMFDLTRKMEAFIQEMRESYRDQIAVSPHDDIDAKYAAEDLQLWHMISSAQMTHLEVLTYLNQIDSARSPDEPSFFSKNLSVIELMLRRSEEYRQLSRGSQGEGDRGTDVDTLVVYSDLYTYWPRVAGRNMTHSEVYLALLTSITEACRNNASSGNDTAVSSGDLARLCSLILDFVQRDTSLAGNDSWNSLVKDVQTVMMRFKADHNNVSAGSPQNFRKSVSSQKGGSSSMRPSRASSGSRRSSRRRAAAASNP